MLACSGPDIRTLCSPEKIIRTSYLFNQQAQGHFKIIMIKRLIRKLIGDDKLIKIMLETVQSCALKMGNLSAEIEQLKADNNALAIYHKQNIELKKENNSLKSQLKDTRIKYTYLVNKNKQILPNKTRQKIETNK